MTILLIVIEFGRFNPRPLLQRRNSDSQPQPEFYSKTAQFREFPSSDSDSFNYYRDGLYPSQR